MPAPCAPTYAARAAETERLLSLDRHHWDRDRIDHLNEVEIGRAHDDWPMFAPTLRAIGNVYEKLWARYYLWRIGRTFGVRR